MYPQPNIKSFIGGKCLDLVVHSQRSISILKFVMTGNINRKRSRQKWIDLVKSNFEKCAPGSRLEESVDCRQR